MRLVYLGKGRRGEVCLEALVAAGRQPLALVLHERGDEALADLGAALGILTHRPDDVNAPEVVKLLRGLVPDLLIMAGYGRILKGEILSVPRKGTLNLHGGRLPEYRGSSPINWSIINGETTGGCSVALVDEGIDTGPVLLQESYPIGPEESADAIVERTLEIFPRLLVEALDQIEQGTASPMPQDDTRACYYHRRVPDDGLIDWHAATAEEIHNLVRALTPPLYPGAFCYLDGEPVTIHRTSRIREGFRGVPGRVVVKRLGGVVVVARDRGLLLEHVTRGRDVRGGRRVELASGDTLTSVPTRLCLTARGVRS